MNKSLFPHENSTIERVTGDTTQREMFPPYYESMIIIIIILGKFKANFLSDPIEG